MMKTRIFLLSLLFTAVGCMPSNARTEKITISGPSGTIVADIQAPDGLGEGQRIPMVMLCHGFMDNRQGQLLKAIADGLEKNGIASIRFDFDGHGESGGKFVDMTVPKEIEDAKAVYEYVKALPYVGKIGIAGHSQGGVVSAMTAGELGKKAFRAVVLLAPAAVLRDDAIRGNTMGRTYDPLSPPDSVALFGNFSLGKQYILSAFRLPIYETAAYYKGKACIIHGTGDRVVPYTYGLRFHQLWKDSEYHEFPAFDHGFSQDIEKAASLAVSFLTSVLL